jgi:hypothetical protein
MAAFIVGTFALMAGPFQSLLLCLFTKGFWYNARGAVRTCLFVALLAKDPGVRQIISSVPTDVMHF